MKTCPREKHDKLVKINKDWSKNEDEWVKYKVTTELLLKELKKKNEDRKHIIKELESRRDREERAMTELKNENYEKMKSELEVLSKKYQNACSEINKLARFVNIFGKNEGTNIQKMSPTSM